MTTAMMPICPKYGCIQACLPTRFRWIGWMLLLGWFAVQGMHGGESSRWTHYKMSDGLPSAGASGVTINPTGSIWISHRDGHSITELNGFDIMSQTVPNGAGNKIHESRSRQLWTTHPTGLFLWFKHRWNAYRVPAIARAYPSPASLIPLQINQCLILANNGLLLFNANDDTITKVDSLPGRNMRPFTEMIELSTDEVVISGMDGFVLFEGPAKEVVHQEAKRIKLPPALTGYQLTSPLENPDGALTFIGRREDHPRQVIRYHQGNWSWLTLEKDIKLRAFWEDTTGAGWGTSYNGLYAIDFQAQTAVKSDVVEASLFFDAVSDGRGNCWIATSEGLIRQSPPYWQSVSRTLGDGTVFDMASDRNNVLWLATEEALVRMDSGLQEKNPWPEQVESIFEPGRCLFVLENGQVGINAGDHPLLFDPVTKQFQDLPDHPSGSPWERILGQQPNGDLILKLTDSNPPSNEPFWTLTATGFDPVEIESELPMPGRDAHWASALSDEIWFGSNEGIAYSKRGQWIVFDVENGLTADTPQCLLELQNGHLWLGAGSHVYELRNSRWERIYFASEKINDMLEARDGTIWIASNNGVHRFFQETWLTYNTQEGLPSNTIYKLHEEADGTILAASIRGISQYAPQYDPSPPITDIQVPDEDKRKGLRNGTVVTFQGLDKWGQTAPSRLLFSYRQDSDTWKPFSPTNHVVLEDLSDGSHRIDVRAMDRNGNIETHWPSLKFEFTPPWYEDPRLITITVTAFILMLVLAVIAVNRHLQLKRSYAEVEKIVAVRTEELKQANRELLQDQKMKALGTLASGIAHDFNSILSIIKGSVQIIESNPNDAAKIRKRVGRIHSVVEQGAGIVQSMLGYVRTKNEPSELHNLNTIVKEAIRLAEENRSQHRIRIQEQPTLPSVHVVPNLVRQMMINLINNACDSMDQAGDIVVRLDRVPTLSGHIALKPSSSGSFAVIEIRDSGVGIAQDMVGRIFEPFYTTKAFSSRRGTGLGLSMVYEMARELGAGLSVDSEPGKGSRFYIYLPISEEAVSASV